MCSFRENGTAREQNSGGKYINQVFPQIINYHWESAALEIYRVLQAI